jgi:hypothetical protein
MAVGASWEETPSEGACADECGPQGERDVVAGNSKRRRFEDRAVPTAGWRAPAGRQAGRQAAGWSLQRRAWPEYDGPRRLGVQVGERGTASEVVTAHSLGNDATGFWAGNAGRPPRP